MPLVNMSTDGLVLFSQESASVPQSMVRQSRSSTMLALQDPSTPWSIEEAPRLRLDTLVDGSTRFHWF